MNLAHESILPNFVLLCSPIFVIGLSGVCNIRKYCLYFKLATLYSKKTEIIFVLRRKNFSKIDSWVAFFCKIINWICSSKECWRERRKRKKNRLICVSLISILEDRNYHEPPVSLVSHLVRVAIWPFLKHFSRNKMIWLFGLFRSWRKKYLFRPIFTFYILRNSKIFDIFGKISLKIWPFVVFENLAFLKLLLTKFGLFCFSGPGNLHLFEVVRPHREAHLLTLGCHASSVCQNILTNCNCWWILHIIRVSRRVSG